MKIAVTSDTHGYLPEIPEGLDLLLLCGDISPLEIQRSVPLMREWIAKEFIPWASKVPKVILVAGNHDIFLERIPRPQEELFSGTNVIYLENTSWTSPEGLTIFGTPFCKIFGNWSWMITDESLERKYSEIPEGIDILLSHDSPTLGDLGKILQRTPVREAGSKILSEALLEKKPKYFFSGHIHSGSHGIHEVEGIKMANVSYVDERYQPQKDSILILEI